MAKGEFFVSFFEDMERGFGFSFSDKNDFNEADFDNGVLIESIGKEIENTKTGETSKMATRFVDFADTMKGYIEFLRFFAGLGSLVSENIGREALGDFLNKNGAVVEERPNIKIYLLPNNKKNELLKIRDLLKSSKIVGREIPQMLLMGLVSSYEHQMSLLARIIIEINPKIIVSKDKTVSILDILEADSIDSIKQKYIDKEVENIFREGVDKQIEWFENKVNISDIKSNHKNIDKFMELFERRNLFAHNNGIVNDIYLSKVSKKYTSDNKISKGDYLRADPRYFYESLDLIIEFGVKLIQVCWRKLVPAESEIADSLLLNLCFELIMSGEYRLAKYLLEFARGLRGDRSEMMTRMFIVNHANSCKLLKEEKEALTILDSVDWSASSNNFQCCVAAVRGDVGETVKYMRKLGKNGEISTLEYQSWPVFYHVRDVDSFKSAFKALFGVDYIPTPIRRGGVVNALGGLAFGILGEDTGVARLPKARKISLRSVN